MARLISGQPCDGILGIDFFEENVVSIGFDNERFALNDAVSEKVKKRLRNRSVEITAQTLYLRP